MKIYAHHDADGVTSAFLLSRALSRRQNLEFKNFEFIFPEDFGDYSQPSKGSYMVDMRPRDPDFEGFVLDHHPDHPEKRKYTLTWDPAPASLIVFKTFRDLIPKKEYWKTVIGVVGDGQPELIPSEIWLLNPELLDYRVYVSQSSGKLYTNETPIYNLLSSGINALCRLGRPMDALELMSKIETPNELLTNEILENARKTVKAAHSKVISEFYPRTLGKFIYWEYYSEVRLSGWLASEMFDTTGITTVAVNLRDGTMSIRGTLASPLAEILRKVGIEADGHPGFCGGKIRKEQIPTLEEILRTTFK